MTEKLKIKKSWDTTLFGALAALGEYLTNIQDPAWLTLVGKILLIISLFFMGARSTSINQNK